MSDERQRLSGCGTPTWKRWGPYLSERQWGTVREDYSPTGRRGTASPTTPARRPTAGARTASPASRPRQRLCFALALWNGRDPILKERLFGLTGREGNHGEDVKEFYYYLDATPTHSYLKILYKYPQAASPTPAGRGEPPPRPAGPEFELLDTGVFDGDRYFDVIVEYAKAGARGHPGPDRGRQPRARARRRSTCCRRSGSATPGRGAAAPRPTRALGGAGGRIEASHPELGVR